MKLTEQAAHLKGLAEGLGCDTTTKEGRLIAALIELTGALADKVQGLEHDLEELNDCVDTLGEDVAALYEDFDDEDDACDGDCANCDDADDCEYADADEETYEIECPACGETICFDETIDPENLVCPACGKKISGEKEEPEPPKAETKPAKSKGKKTTK